MFIFLKLWTYRHFISKTIQYWLKINVKSFTLHYSKVFSVLYMYNIIEEENGKVGLGNLVNSIFKKILIQNLKSNNPSASLLFILIQ
jgi:hypothetical protein